MKEKGVEESDVEAPDPTAAIVHIEKDHHRKPKKARGQKFFYCHLFMNMVS